MNWKKFIAEADRDLAIYSKATPGTLEAFGKMGEAAKKGKAVDLKTKEFVAIGVAISTMCDHCIGYHARNLVRLGAKREELAEVLAMVAYMGGGPAINYGSKALQAFDQFSE